MRAVKASKQGKYFGLNNASKLIPSILLILPPDNYQTVIFLGISHSSYNRRTYCHIVASKRGEASRSREGVSLLES